jgi:molybdenum cofactor cytidylyltransferase
LSGAARRTERSNREPKVSAILLAAGLSTRFGSPKQLAELEGDALVRRALDMLERSPVDEVVVVLGHRASEVGKVVFGAKARVVFNEEYKSGMASSIRAGLAALGRDSRAVVICLADQPLVSPRLIGRIVSRWRSTGADVVASSSQGLVSPPVLFSRRLYHELAKLRGDRGAKVVIERHPDFETVPVRGGALLDIDSKEELLLAQDALRRLALRRPARARADDGP